MFYNYLSAFSFFLLSFILSPCLLLIRWEHAPSWVWLCARYKPQILLLLLSMISSVTNWCYWCNCTFQQWGLQIWCEQKLLALTWGKRRGPRLSGCVLSMRQHRNFEHWRLFSQKHFCEKYVVIDYGIIHIYWQFWGVYFWLINKKQLPKSPYTDTIVIRLHNYWQAVALTKNTVSMPSRLSLYV